ncbi:MAG: hypothetical protein WCO91_05565, partial [Gemmataceae bacterium]
GERMELAGPRGARGALTSQAYGKWDIRPSDAGEHSNLPALPCLPIVAPFGLVSVGKTGHSRARIRGEFLTMGTQRT